VPAVKKISSLTPKSAATDSGVELLKYR